MQFPCKTKAKHKSSMISSITYTMYDVEKRYIPTRKASVLSGECKIEIKSNLWKVMQLVSGTVDLNQIYTTYLHIYF